MGQEIETSLELFEEQQASPRIDGVVIGVLRRLDDSGSIFVDYPSNPSTNSLSARSTVQATKDDCGREVALMFEEGNPERPIIMGFIQHAESVAKTLRHKIPPMEDRAVTIRVDEKRLTITAEKEIVIQCGKASIILSQDGKVLVRGTYLSSRSSGPNLIKGGSVQLN
jgi:hypothetical protein